ncbi:MAG: flagellar hook-associated protein FlgK [Defluviitaleaceae bacterium]|nr:flagellar hook-associated protein FlgK [Defluviitaleaceae bacterium]
MRSSFFGLHLASSGLFTARANLNVTSHNLANSEIPGFSRQQAQMQAARPLQGTGRGMYGTGSQVTGIIQIRCRFMDRRFWHQSQIHGQFTAVHQHLSFVETVFNNLSDAGINRTFNNFFGTLQDLTTRAGEPTFRTNVTSVGDDLAHLVRQHASSLQRQQSDLNREVADIVTTINSLGQQISDINRQIHLFERDGSNANDLRDQRALMIDRLSVLINVEVNERDFSDVSGVRNDLRMSILINGYEFVSHTQVNLLDLVPRNNILDPRSGPSRNEMDVSGLYDVFFRTTGARFNLHSPTLGGKLKGIIDVRDGNGGQVTVPPTLTGQRMIADNLATLTRTSSFITNLQASLASMNAAVPGLVARRDDVFDNLSAIITSNPALTPVTNTAETNALLNHLVSIRTERTSRINSLQGIRTSIIQSVGFEGLRTSIANEISLADYPAVQAALDAVQAHLNAFANIPHLDLETTDVTDFRDGLQALLDTLETELLATGSFDDSTIITGIANLRDTNLDTLVTPLYNTLEWLEETAAVYGDVDDLNNQITFVTEQSIELRTVINGIREITTYGDRIQSQLDWAIRNVQNMQHEVETRIAEIESGFSLGDVEAYQDFLAVLLAQLDAMETFAEALSLPPYPLDVYSDEAALTAFIADLNGVIMDGFADAIDEIAQAAAALLPEGRETFVGRTTNFKGIPFYMNQLNELVRTFARAMNEGRNRAGDPIYGSIGHMFGFDANGENRNSMFFTFTHPVTNEAAAMLDADDPMRNLRMWILADPSDPTGATLLRDAHGNLVTVHDPEPPMGIPNPADPTQTVSVARDSMGNPLFTLDYSQLNALNFKVNQELLDDPRLLAASSNHNVGLSNNDIIDGFLAVFNDTTLFREGRLHDFISATSTHLAVDNQQARNFRESYTEITMQTHNQRLSVKSVDTEEEMINLVRFQTMFIAASRLVNVIDTVYDTLINRLGNF